MTGKQIIEAMRRNRKTIGGLAAKMGITQKRVRFVRANGIEGAGFVQDWMEAIECPAEIARLGEIS
jgi:hypothetical protein